MIRFNQVKKSPCLNGISFVIRRNELVILDVKDEKSMKVLRGLISGEIKPERGVIRLLNNYVPGDKILAHEIGVVHEESLLLPGRTLLENLKFIAEIKGLTGSYVESRVRKTLELVNLEACASCVPGKLLPHQLKRASISRALISYPSLLVLENPFQKIDEVNGRALYYLLEEINDLGITVVILVNDSSGKAFPVNKGRQRVIYLIS